MDSDNSTHSLPPQTSPKHKAEAPVPIACDACYIRKVRCDRKTPCSNCIDSKAACLRERQKCERKPKNILPKELLEFIGEVRGRMTTIETSVDRLINLANGTVVPNKYSSRNSSRKRNYDEVFSESLSRNTSPFSGQSPFVAPCSDSQFTPPFSASEAHDLIEDQLSRVPNTDAGKKTAFNTALNWLKQNLNTSIIENQSTYTTGTISSLNNISIPPVSLIHWMVQSSDTGRSVCSNDFMPFTSRGTIAAMGKDVLNSETPEECNLASLICVSTYAFYFLQEIVLSDVRQSTGLEDRLRLQANEYFTAGRVAASHIRTQMTSCLSNLQGLTYGVNLAQEAGDFVAAWLLTEAASKMCIELGLHKRTNIFSSSSTMAREAYYCFATNYMNDKGLAMNLGRPAFIQDTLVEMDLMRPPNSSNSAIDNFRIYLELAKIQSRIIEELRPAKEARLHSRILASILTKMDDIWQLNMQLQSIKQTNQDSRYDSTMDSTLVDFAFHSVKTVIFHSSSERNQGSLDAARAALNSIQRIRELSKFSQYNSTYMRSSFAHWTVLYYPFTPFFVLLCNVICMRHEPDYHIMQRFVEYLWEVRDISISVSKLHKLCIPFCSLAAGVLGIVPDEKPFQLDPIYDGEQKKGEASPSPFISTWRDPHSHQPTSHPSTLAQQQPYLDSSTHNSIPLEQGYLLPQRQMSGATPDQNFDDIFANDSIHEFMDTQPVLQWMDTDFSALADMWMTDDTAFPNF